MIVVESRVVDEDCVSPSGRQRRMPDGRTAKEAEGSLLRGQLLLHALQPVLESKSWTDGGAI